MKIQLPAHDVEVEGKVIYWGYPELFLFCFQESVTVVFKLHCNFQYSAAVGIWHSHIPEVALVVFNVQTSIF